MNYTITNPFCKIDPDNTVFFSGVLRENGNLKDGAVNATFFLSTTKTAQGLTNTDGYNDAGVLNCATGAFTCDLTKIIPTKTIRIGKLWLCVKIDVNMFFFPLVSNYTFTPSDGVYSGLVNVLQRPLDIETKLMVRTYPLVWNLQTTPTLNIQTNITLKNITQITSFMWSDAKDVFHNNTAKVTNFSTDSVLSLQKPPEITNTALYTKTSDILLNGVWRGWVNIWYNDY